MGVEQGESGGLGQRGAAAQGLATPGGLKAAGVAQPLEGFPPVPGQKRRARQCQRTGQLRAVAQGAGHAKDAGE
jgi:hypothetical protein